MARTGDGDAAEPATDRDDERPHSAERTPVTSGDERPRAAFAEPAPAVTPLRKGQLIADVYEIVERIGDGGMGIVYLARDRRLARNVALKVIRTQPSSTSVTRLVREAQAIAQLSHPNVVTIYQIGTHEEQPFVAMEYVAGGTARAWIMAKPRTWREIVALYLAAGRGLEAAHQARLVHRDFKPDNVLVGDDGRVRVADFGLVQTTTAATMTDDGDAPSAPGATVTRTGMVMGTPAYMAPEQRAGAAVDSVADQFAFAVALWEALTGARPFADSEPPTAEGIVPPKRPMPRHIEVALRRALSVEPAARWPGMGPLLAALGRDPSATRRRVAYGAGALLASAAIVVPLAMRGDGGPEPCTDSDATIAKSWNAEQRVALLATLGPHAGTLVTEGLDRYAKEWAVEHRRACRATHVSGSQTEDMLERRMLCLFAARAALDATVSVLRTATDEGRAKATDAIGRLPGLDQCSDIQALAVQDPLPTDPAVRRDLEQAARQLAAVHLQDLAPKRIDRKEFADAALARARSVGWPPLIARALLVHAQQLKLAQQLRESIVEVREAIGLAIASNMSDVAATAFADLATLLAEQDQIDAAEVALLAARGYEERLGPLSLHRVVRARGVVASRAQRHDEAVALARELVVRVDKDPNWTLNPMTSRHQLANVLAAAGRFVDAIPVIDEALAWGVANFGEDHAQVGSYRGMRAAYLMNIGRFDEAIADAKSGLAILEKWYGPTSVQLSEVLLTLGDAHSRAGRLEPVMAYLDQGLICARNGEDQEMIAAIETQRTIYYLRIGDLAHAEPAANALVEAAGRTTSTNAKLESLLIRGNTLKDLKRYADAERDFLRALEIGKPFGEHPAIQNLRVELGKTWNALNRASETRTMLEAQIEVLATDVDPILALETYTTLASALHALGDKPRARELAGEAARISRENPDRADLRATVNDWYAKHR